MGCFEQNVVLEGNAEKNNYWEKRECGFAKKIA